MIVGVQKHRKLKKSKKNQRNNSHGRKTRECTMSMPGAPRARKKRRNWTVKPVKTRHFALDGWQGCTNIKPTEDMGKGVFLKSRASALHKGDHLLPKKDTHHLINLKAARKRLGHMWYIDFGNVAIILRSSDVEKSTIYCINSSAKGIQPNVEYKYNRCKNQLYLMVLKTIEPGSQLFVRYDPDHDIFPSTPTRK